MIISYMIQRQEVFGFSRRDVLVLVESSSRSEYALTLEESGVGLSSKKILHSAIRSHFNHKLILGRFFA